jgi:hypothetical protein
MSEIGGKSTVFRLSREAELSASQPLSVQVLKTADGIGWLAVLLVAGRKQLHPVVERVSQGYRPLQWTARKNDGV